MPGDRWGETEQVPLVNAGQQCSCPLANLCAQQGGKVPDDKCPAEARHHEISLPWRICTLGWGLL